MKKIYKSTLLAAVCAVSMFCASERAFAFGGENAMEGNPWHHFDITLRALTGDANLKNENPAFAANPIYPGIGFSREAAMSVAWHADNLDSYLYNPLFWVQGGWGENGSPRFKAALVDYAELVKLHFDDTFSQEGLNEAWRRYASGTLVGLYWAALNNDVAAAQHILGVSLHAVEDFYSHSNWINQPERRTKTWLEADKSMRIADDLRSGAYEDNSLPTNINPSHGKYALQCTLTDILGANDLDQAAATLQNNLRSAMGWACNPVSLFANTSICQKATPCNDLPKFSLTVFDKINTKLYLEPVGIALDSTSMAAVQGKVRMQWINGRLRPLLDEKGNFSDGDDVGFVSKEKCAGVINFGFSCDEEEACKVKNPRSCGQNADRLVTADSERLFATAKDLAARTAAQWVMQMEQAMIALNLEAFWKRVKTEPTSVSQRAAQFETFSQLPFQFLSAGPYPTGVGQNASLSATNRSGADTPSQDGHYLRVRLKTANQALAGTDADIYLDVDGVKIKLDYLPTNDPNAKTNNPLLVYNDFEQGDNDVYTVGPFQKPPQRITLINESASAGDLALQAAKSLIDSFNKALKIGTDYIGENSVTLTQQKLLEIAVDPKVGPPPPQELLVNGGAEGVHALIYKVWLRDDFLTPEERQAGWRAFHIAPTNLRTFEESISDGSPSDEVYFFASFAQVNGVPRKNNKNPAFAADEVKYYRSGIIEDVDRGEVASLAPAVDSIGWDNYKEEFRIKVAPRGKVVVSVRMFESDNEFDSTRTELWNQFRTGLNPDTFLDVAGRTVAAGWNLEEIEVFGFQRSNTPTAGYVLPTTRVGEIDGGARREFSLNWSGVRPLLVGPVKPISEWKF